MPARSLILAACLAGAPALAGDDGGIGRLAEMPAHRVLMARIAEPGAALAGFDARLAADRALQSCVIATGEARVEAMAVE